MQTIKEKLNDMSHMRKAKAQAKEEEKEEVDLAKTRIQVAKEVRLAREAEAAMDLHVNKAAEKVAQQEAKYSHSKNANQLPTDAIIDPDYGASLGNEGYSTPHQTCGEDCQGPYTGHGTTSKLASNAAATGTGNLASNTAAIGTGYPTNTAGGPPTNNIL
ncbi:uncharacterized protein [Coffea arabica]|uniref:Uncharacterized protein n=1 Tax=Coffea arabica TaxID=13443 RepID=A0A6P6W2Y8_COFAR|nr:late embryogenesis abundant protein 6-like [Coffea arabica]